jgi:predicted DNA binding CopG/RHH family protein
MRNGLISALHLAWLLSFMVLINCSSTEKRTEERAKERVTQFIRLMAEDRIQEAEELLSQELAQGETKELFLDSYDNWQLKDTSIVIEVSDLTFHVKDDSNRAVVSLTVRNDRIRFTRRASMPLKFEKGDWYIGG